MMSERGSQLSPDERRRRVKERSRKSAQCRIYISEATNQWRTVKTKFGFERDGEFAKFLLDNIAKQNDITGLSGLKETVSRSEERSEDMRVDRFLRCGWCGYGCQAVSHLHHHLQSHTQTGSYFYDNLTNTGYPKNWAVSVGTQTSDFDYPRDWTILAGTQTSYSEHNSGNMVINNSTKTSDVGSENDVVTNTNSFLSKVRQTDDSFFNDLKAGKRYLSKDLLGSPMNIKTESDEVNIACETSDSHEAVPTVKIEIDEAKDPVDNSTTESSACVHHNRTKRKRKAPSKYRDYDSDSISDSGGSSTDSCNDILPIISRDENLSGIEKVMFREAKVTDCTQREDTSSATLDSDGKPELLDLADDSVSCTEAKRGDTQSDSESISSNTVPRSHTKNKSDSDSDYQPSDDEYAADGYHQNNIALDLGYKCIYCESTYRQHSNLTKHILAKHPEEKAYDCLKCKEYFHKKEELTSHIEQHQTVKEKACEDANKRVAYSCFACDFKYRRLSVLQRHALEEHGCDRPFKCPGCDKCFRALLSFRAHYLRCLNIRDFKCEDCGKCYIYKKDLTIHRKSQHSPKCVCEVCGKSVGALYLPSHIRSHKTLKPFSCSVCTKKFSKKEGLKDHMKTHTNQRDNVCYYCGKSFIRREALKIHLLQHTGETPFKCDRCDQGFKQRVLLKRHMVQKHKHELSSEDIVKYKSSTTVKLGIEKILK